VRIPCRQNTQRHHGKSSKEDVVRHPGVIRSKTDGAKQRVAGDNNAQRLVHAEACVFQDVVQMFVVRMERGFAHPETGEQWY